MVKMCGSPVLFAAKAVAADFLFKHVDAALLTMVVLQETRSFSAIC